MDSESYHIILRTCPDHSEAARIAHALVEEKLAAAVNMVPRVDSVFRWQGEINTVSETLLIIKSRTSHYDEIERKIRSMHSYDVPAIVALPIVAGARSYLDWIAGQ